MGRRKSKKESSSDPWSLNSDYTRRTVILTSLVVDEEIFMAVDLTTTLKHLFDFWAEKYSPNLYLTNKSTGERANNPNSPRLVTTFAKPGDTLVFTNEEYLRLPQKILLVVTVTSIPKVEWS